MLFILPACENEGEDKRNDTISKSESTGSDSTESSVYTEESPYSDGEEETESAKISEEESDIASYSDYFSVMNKTPQGDILFAKYGGKDKAAYRAFLTMEYSLGEDSFTTKAKPITHTIPEGVTVYTTDAEKPKADFSSLRNEGFITYYEDQPTQENIIYSYDEAKALVLPVCVLIEAVPLTDNVISDIQAENGADKKSAVSAFNSLVTDAFEESGLYVESAFTLLFYDSTRAFTLEGHNHGIDVQSPPLTDFLYSADDYHTCTTRYYCAYGTIEQLEALEKAALSDENSSFKISVFPMSGTSVNKGTSMYPTDNDGKHPRGYDICRMLAETGVIYLY